MVSAVRALLLLGKTQTARIFLRELLVSMNMTYDVTLLILLAAALQAGWHALIEIGLPQLSRDAS